MYTGTVNISNSAALNDFVIASNPSGALNSGRVIGSTGSYATLSDNLANKDMKLGTTETGAAVTSSSDATSKDGADVNIATDAGKTAVITTLNGGSNNNAAIWEWKAGAAGPTLK
jgi:hypothetical protein